MTRFESPSRWRPIIASGAALALLSVIAVETPDAQRDAFAGGPAGVSDSFGAGTIVDGAASGANLEGDGGAGSQAARQRAAGGGPTGGEVQTGNEGDQASQEAQAGQGSDEGQSNIECTAGRNGGATDVGVSGDEIRLAATNVRSGVGSSFLGSTFVGMRAVEAKVNASGGVCGRLLKLELVDDGWDAARGAGFIQNFIKEGYFALPVVPSSEGLTQAILNGTISGAGIPVVGSDGMLREQYQNDWVWPVATATVSTIRIMVKHARDNGAKTFGIVYDQRYRFGVEGAEAFKQYVKQLSGAELTAYVGITPEKPDYSSEAKAFNDACGGTGCDFVAMLLDPVTANTYIASQTDKNGRRQGFGNVLTGGAQPLFNERFARDCGRPCDGMLVWTGYNPPIGGKAGLPDVSEYVNDVRSIDPGVDANNQFLEGAYFGMQVFVAALEKVGPNLTRARLAAAMNSLTYESDLAGELTWEPNQRFANTHAQPFRIVTAGGSFAGFADASVGFLPDPTPGVVPG